MKTFFKKFFLVIAILLSITIVTNLTNEQPAYAEDCRDFAGLKSWDCGFSGSDATSPKAWNSNDKITNNIWLIVANVSNNVFVIAAYLIIGFIIYGGYLYMASSGDPGKVSSGKKTLSRAFIGLAIVMSAKVIVSSIHIALLGKSGAFSENCLSTSVSCNSPGQLVTNLIQWVIGVAGVIAVIFVVIGAIGYLTSAGDPNKAQKAKNTILYALIGLAIVGLSEVISAFVSNTIREANKHAYINLTITKELK